jgi:hypothetical protein
MTMHDWVTSSRISELEKLTHHLISIMDAAEATSDEHATSIADARILATQAYLMYFHQLAAMSPDPQEFRDCAMRTLKAQGLSSKTLKEIEQWTASICGATNKRGNGGSGTIPTDDFSEQVQSALTS